MSDWKWLQVRLPGDLHGKLAAHALSVDVGMSEMVRGWIEEAVNGLRVGSTDGDAQRGVAKARSKTVKVERLRVEPTSDSKSPTPRSIDTS